MKAYILLELNGEYHDYDIFVGAFATYEDAYYCELKKFNYIDKIGVHAYRHQHDERNSKPHTHVCLWRSLGGQLDHQEYVSAVLDNEEENLDNWDREDICVLRNFIIEEWEL